MSASFHEVLFPLDIALKSAGGPERRTDIVTFGSGREERNARWADWIRARLRTPGTVFVAVGAGHLAGKDSVLAQLGERGIYSTRLN